MATETDLTGLEALVLDRDHLARVRQHFADVKESYRVLEEQFKAKHSNLIAQVQQLREAINHAEEEIKNRALEHYDETGEKRPIPGVEVKMRKTLDYDPADALVWAHRHDLCLTLDKPEFERVAKALGLAFVRYGEEPYATLAKELPQT